MSLNDSNGFIGRSQVNKEAFLKLVDAFEKFLDESTVQFKSDLSLYPQISDAKKINLTVLLGKSILDEVGINQDDLSRESKAKIFTVLIPNAFALVTAVAHLEASVENSIDFSKKALDIVTNSNMIPPSFLAKDPVKEK